MSRCIPQDCLKQRSIEGVNPTFRNVPTMTYDTIRRHNEQRTMPPVTGVVVEYRSPSSLAFD